MKFGCKKRGVCSVPAIDMSLHGYDVLPCLCCPSLEYRLVLQLVDLIDTATLATRPPCLLIRVLVNQVHFCVLEPADERKRLLRVLHEPMVREPDLHSDVDSDEDIESVMQTRAHDSKDTKSRHDIRVVANHPQYAREASSEWCVQLRADTVLRASMTIAVSDLRHDDNDVRDRALAIPSRRTCNRGLERQRGR